MLTRRWKSSGTARTIWVILAIAVVFTCLASTGFAQSTTSSTGWDAYYIGYYGNANMGFPNAEVNIVNPGSTGGYSAFDPFGPSTPDGDLCANIYVFTSDQEMVECCSCFVSPNALRTLSVDGDLTANPLANTGVVPPPHAGVVKIVSSYTELSGDVCSTTFTNPAGATKNLSLAGTDYTPFGSLRTWVTHIRETVGGASPLFTLTETAFRREDLARDGSGPSGYYRDSELRKLQEQCQFLQVNGSGHGICTCGTGD